MITFGDLHKMGTPKVRSEGRFSLGYIQGLAHKLYSEGELPSFAQKGDSIWNLQVVRTHLHPRLGDLHPRFQGGIAFNSNQNRVKPLEDLCQKSGPDAVFLSFFRGTNGCLVFLELVPLFIWCLMDTGTTTMLGGSLKHKHTQIATSREAQVVRSNEINFAKDLQLRPIACVRRPAARAQGAPHTRPDSKSTQFAPIGPGACLTPDHFVFTRAK